MYLYTVSNLLINVLLLGQNVEKKFIMGVIHGQIFIIIYDISYIIYFPIQLLSPKMHNKHAFSPGVLYSEHV